MKREMKREMASRPASPHAVRTQVGPAHKRTERLHARTPAHRLPLRLEVQNAVKQVHFFDWWSWFEDVTE